LTSSAARSFKATGESDIGKLAAAKTADFSKQMVAVFGRSQEAALAAVSATKTAAESAKHAGAAAASSTAKAANAAGEAAKSAGSAAGQKLGAAKESVEALAVSRETMTNFFIVFGAGALIMTLAFSFLPTVFSFVIRNASSVRFLTDESQHRTSGSTSVNGNR